MGVGLSGAWLGIEQLSQALLVRSTPEPLMLEQGCWVVCQGGNPICQEEVPRGVGQGVSTMMGAVGLTVAGMSV